MNINIFIVGSVALALSACGSGNKIVRASLPLDEGILSPTNSSLITIRSNEIDSVNQATILNSGTLDGANGIFSLGDLKGQLDYSTNLVTLNGGGNVSINSEGRVYVAKYTAQPNGFDPAIGVFGEQTNPTTLISQRATYSGSVELQVIDGNSVFDLTGTASADANFSSGGLDIGFSSLSGLQKSGLVPAVTVSDFGTVSIDNGRISGVAFSGGTAQLKSTQTSTSLSGAQTVDNSGAFFGPDASEIGGVFVIDDTNAGGSLLMLGVFTGG